jgi:hypothetical protein
MYFIDPKTIQDHRWTITQGLGDYWVVMSIDGICPHCHKAVTITLEPLALMLQTQSAGMKGRCPRCSDDKVIRVFLTGIRQKNNFMRQCESIWVEPIPEVKNLVRIQVSVQGIRDGIGNCSGEITANRAC